MSDVSDALYGNSIDEALPSDWDKCRPGTVHKVTQDALQKQVGGTHYKSLNPQPIELCYQRFGWDGVKASLLTKADKYTSRDKGDFIENIDKAIHCLELLKDYWRKSHG